MDGRALLKAVGFWKYRPEEERYCPEVLHDLPHPGDFIDEGWELQDRPRIVQYLKSGVRWNRFLGYSWCRLPGGPPDKEMGNADLCDGVWLWPEGLHVYVDRFHVRLPDEFVAHMRQNEFVIPGDLARANFPEHDVDFSFWKRWADVNRKCVNGVKREDEP